MNKYNLQRFIKTLLLFSLIPLIYVIMNLGNSKFFHCGHINDLKAINKFWNHNLYGICKVLLLSMTMVWMILTIVYFTMFSRISDFFSKILNFRFYLKYKGTNWTRKEVRSLRSRNYRFRTINGEVLFLSQDNDNEYAIKKTTDCSNRKIYIYLINKEVVSKSENLSIGRFEHYSVPELKINIPKNVLDIVSIFKEFRTISSNGYFYIVMPEGYHQILTREELNSIRNSFPMCSVDFSGTYIAITPIVRRSIYDLQRFS